MSILAFLSPDIIPLSFLNHAMDLMVHTSALEALSAVSLAAIKDGNVRVHRLVQEVMRQRVHETQGFDFINKVIRGMLTAAVRHEPTKREIVFENTVWALHYDPSPDASLVFSYEHSQLIELEITFSNGTAVSSASSASWMTWDGPSIASRPFIVSWEAGHRTS